MVLALALAAIVLSSLQSMILIAGKAVPDEGGMQESTVNGSDVLERLASEVSVAVEILDVDTTSIAFSVNDWDDDGVVESIKYGWSGVAGDPLLRAVNGGAATVVLDSVTDFALTPATKVIETRVAALPTRYEDQDVQSVGVVGVVGTTVDTGTSLVQRIVPDLPEATETWRISRVSLWLWANLGTDKDLVVEIRGYDADKGGPDGTVYKQEKYATKDLGLVAGRVDIDFSTPKFGPDAELCIVLWARESDVSCRVLTGIATTALNGRTAGTSSDGGSTWSTVAGWAIAHEVLADVWTSSVDSESRTELVELDACLRLGTPVTTIKRAVRPLNTPEVVP